MQVVVVGEDADHGGVLVAEQELDRAVLRRLEAGGLAEVVAELDVLDRGQGLEHRPLLEHLLLDGLDARQALQGGGDLVDAEQGDGRSKLVHELLEPELGDLVLNDEQHLVVMVGERLLGGEQGIEVQVARIGELAAQVGGDTLLDRPERRHPATLARAVIRPAARPRRERAGCCPRPTTGRRGQRAPPGSPARRVRAHGAACRRGHRRAAGHPRRRGRHPRR